VSEVVGLDTTLDLDRYTATQMMVCLLAKIRTKLEEMEEEMKANQAEKQTGQDGSQDQS
jgi:hypothetical protein